MSKNLLIIFTRNPEKGKVKTRLAKSIGDQKALEIYKFLLQRTKEIALDMVCDKAVYYSNEIPEHDLWDHNFSKHLQSAGDLGIKMQNAFHNSFKEGYQKVIIIGSDLYDLEPHHISEAFEQLNQNDAVMGPALDGGYYLLGLKEVYPKIFQNKKWGTSTVQRDTLNDLEKVKLHLLEELNDVDVIEDIKDHPAFSQFLQST